MFKSKSGLGKLVESDKYAMNAYRDYDFDRRIHDIHRLGKAIEHFDNAVTQGMIAMKGIASALEAVGQAFTELTLDRLPTANNTSSSSNYLHDAANDNNNNNKKAITFATSTSAKPTTAHVLCSIPTNNKASPGVSSSTPDSNKETLQQEHDTDHVHNDENKEKTSSEHEKLSAYHGGVNTSTDISQSISRSKSCENSNITENYFNTNNEDNDNVNIGDDNDNDMEVNNKNDHTMTRKEYMNVNNDNTTINNDNVSTANKKGNSITALNNSKLIEPQTTLLTNTTAITNINNHNNTIGLSDMYMSEESHAQVRQLAQMFAEESRRLNEGAPFQSYNTGIHRDVITRLRPVTEHVKGIEEFRKVRTEALDKYNKYKTEVEKIEKQYAKKGRPFCDSKSHKKYTAKRDAAWREFEVRREKFNETFNMLMEINDHAAAQIIHRYLALNDEYLKQLIISIERILPAMEMVYPLNSEYSSVQNSLIVEAVAASAIKKTKPVEVISAKNTMAIEVSKTQTTSTNNMKEDEENDININEEHDVDNNDNDNTDANIKASHFDPMQGMPEELDSDEVSSNDREQSLSTSFDHPHKHDDNEELSNQNDTLPCYVDSASVSKIKSNTQVNEEENVDSVANRNTEGYRMFSPDGGEDGSKVHFSKLQAQFRTTDHDDERACTVEIIRDASNIRDDMVHILSQPSRMQPPFKQENASLASVAASSNNKNAHDKEERTLAEKVKSKDKQILSY